MDFTLDHTRQTIGQELDVKVVADKGQRIISVTTEFDGFALAEDTLASPSVQYERVFPGATAGSGQRHTLVVTATDSKGSSESATKIWVDQN